MDAVSRDLGPSAAPAVNGIVTDDYPLKGDGDTMTASQHPIRVRRIYDDPSPDDGSRVVVDRLWPRGVSKENAALDQWCKDVAPSPDLRRWYRHDAELFDEFADRYREELGNGAHAEALSELRALAAHGALTLLTATKHPELSEAAVLAELLNR